LMTYWTLREHRDAKQAHAFCIHGRTFNAVSRESPHCKRSGLSLSLTLCPRPFSSQSTEEAGNILTIRQRLLKEVPVFIQPLKNRLDREDVGIDRFLELFPLQWR